MRVSICIHSPIEAIRARPGFTIFETEVLPRLASGYRESDILPPIQRMHLGEDSRWVVSKHDDYSLRADECERQ